MVQGRPVLDEALVETVADLVEFPTAVCGAFKPEYLELPREVIVTPMQKHQRYFPVVDAAGNLLPYFVTISNMRAKDMELIRQGNERVLRARLNDAEFFFREDRKRPLPDRLPELRQIIFQEKLGSVADKVRAAPAPGRLDRGAGGPRRPHRGRAGRPPLQGGPSDQHGQGVPQPAGNHGTGIRPPLRRAARGLPGDRGALSAPVRRRPTARLRRRGRGGHRRIGSIPS